MPTPQRDALGNVVPHDDPDILPEHGLIRLISRQHHVVWDGNKQVWRVSSGAFSESNDGGMSVDLEALLVAAGVAVLINVPSGDDWGAMRLPVGSVRAEGLRIGSDPLPHNPYHGAVWGIGNRNGVKKRLLRMATWLKPLRNVDA